MSRSMRFTVYAAGDEMARIVVARLQDLCAQNNVTPQIAAVDITAEPHAAEHGNVIGVPTVVREEPAPRRRVIGALDDGRRVSEALGLDAPPAEGEGAQG